MGPSSLERREILTPAPRTDCEDTTLSETSQQQTDDYCVIPLLGGPYSGFTETDSAHGAQAGRPRRQGPIWDREESRRQAPRCREHVDRY